VVALSIVLLVIGMFGLQPSMLLLMYTPCCSHV